MFITSPKEANGAKPASRRSPPDHDYCQLFHPDSPKQTQLVSMSPSLNLKTSTNQEQDPAVLGTTNAPQSAEVSANPSKRLKLVAVHLGAGNGCNNEAEKLKFAKFICEEVMLQTKSTNLTKSTKKKRKAPLSLETTDNNGYDGDGSLSAESAVVQLVKRMEDHQSLNCGFGSNLNIQGQVECDASLMCDKTQIWSGVGAVSGCRNPIVLAKSLYDHRNSPRPLGLVQPNILVGSGAKQWMRDNCPHLSIMDSKLISSKAFSTYVKLKSRYDAASKLPSDYHYRNKPENVDGICQEGSQSDIQSIVGDPNSPTNLDHGSYCAATGEKHLAEPKRRFSSNIPILLKNRPQLIKSTAELRLDTVGAVAVDCDNNFASAISSGGLLLKYKGRLGQAALPGAGCWSEDSTAATTTGVGEYLTMNMFAKKFFDKIQTLRLLYDLGHVDPEAEPSNLISCGVEECFEDLMRSSALEGIPLNERLAGILAVCTFNSKDSSKREPSKDDLYLSYAHNTSTMCIGYMTSNDLIAHSTASRKLEADKDGQPVITTIKFTLNNNGNNS